MKQDLLGTATRAAAALLCAVLILLPGLASAELRKPSGQVLLTVSGKISETNAVGEALLDRTMLEEVGMRTLKTSNPFEEGTQTYEGILLRDLLNRVGASGDTLIAHALDGYTVEIPTSDAAKYPVLLAMKWNGKAMDVRNKGPIWIIYPIDEFPELKTEEISGRSIWQLDKLLVQ